jgi:hypothetical protein
VWRDGGAVLCHHWQSAVKAVLSPHNRQAQESSHLHRVRRTRDQQAALARESTACAYESDATATWPRTVLTDDYTHTLARKWVRQTETPPPTCKLNRPLGHCSGRYVPMTTSQPTQTWHCASCAPLKKLDKGVVPDTRAVPWRQPPDVQRQKPDSRPALRGQQGVVLRQVPKNSSQTPSHNHLHFHPLSSATAAHRQSGPQVDM